MFLRLLSTLGEAERKPKVVMEPTGTYGDALRYRCHRLGVTVHMMPPKHTHDFAYDGTTKRGGAWYRRLLVA